MLNKTVSKNSFYGSFLESPRWLSGKKNPLANSRDTREAGSISEL